jgi:hypothetical protein
MGSEAKNQGESKQESKIWISKKTSGILLQSTFGCWMLGEVQPPHWPLSLSMIL